EANAERSRGILRFSWPTKLAHRVASKTIAPRPQGLSVAAGCQRLILALGGFDRLDHHVLTHRAPVHKLDAAGDLRKQGVVFAAADVQAGLHTRAALAHDDGSAGRHLPAECLEAKPLRVGIAPVS